NEEQSARYATRILGDLAISRDTRATVATLILQTKTHSAADEDIDGQVLLDADLAILGTPEAEYDRYTAAIRQEYSWVSESDYRSGRKAILERFLQRERIYRTASMHQKLEASARRNLQREIEALGRHAP